MMTQSYEQQGNEQSGNDLPRLSRAQHGRPAAPERIIHLGVGNFTRAHQAWYTEHATDRGEWGIAAFTGRSERMVKALRPQDDVYTLITSGPSGDEFEVISSLSSVHAGTDMAALRRYFADPRVAIVTSTVTEAGYMRNHVGDLDTDNDSVAADLASLKADNLSDDLATIPVKVVAGLLARRQADAGPITILPCDNLEGNGAAFRRVVEQAMALVDPTLRSWSDGNVAWATSMVDRITPATTQEDRREVAQHEGWLDDTPVRTEPFREWVISGDFPKGRPAWDDAGAVFTDDVTPYEHRKLWMLNGSHSTLAYTGTLFGYESIAEAIADPTLLAWVNEWWDLAGSYLPLPSDDYRAELLERFSNPRIHHHLVQIAADGSVKLPVRIVPVARKAVAEGRTIVPAARAVAAWIQFLRLFGDKTVGGMPEGAKVVNDVNREEVLRLAQSQDPDALREIVGYLDKDLARSKLFTTEVSYQLDEVFATDRLPAAAG